MKKIASLLFAGTLIFGSANGQILSEQNVTINMELQPVLQLDMEGPEVVDFSFTTIDQYRNGITRYGANVLKVSASVSFDLWANGYSQGMNTGAETNRYFDILGNYTTTAVGANSNIPCSALELHQFPANPAQLLGVNCGGNATGADPNMDYSAAFVDPSGAGTGNNAIYSAQGGNPYFAPDDATGATHDKYIAGGKSTTVGCQVVGGTYLQQTLDPSNATEAGAITTDGYYFVMDYRIVPGLPARFPMSDPTRQTNGAATSGAAYLAAGLDIHNAATPTAYINPGSYQMGIKYILVEDQ
jgi:hypothetical protein